MAQKRLAHKLEQALAKADIRIGGDRPWDLRIDDDRIYRALMRDGLVGLGESYAQGWWSSPAVDQLFDRALRANLTDHLPTPPSMVIAYLKERLFNQQTKPAASRNGRAHYDMGNDLFVNTLDKNVVYSCAYWEGANSLDEAQENKLELICQKLDLKPGMRVLDIGCGWGGLARHMAANHGCSVVGVTVSGEQKKFADERCKGLDVDIRVQDYRDVTGTFDRITSIGMFEHVGPRNYRVYMESVRRLLTPQGLCLLHFFATQRSWPNLRDTEVLWVQQRIFPGLVVPSLAQIGKALDGLLVLEDLHNFGADYDPTLMAWNDNFQRNWPNIQDQYDEHFKRLWTYYLLSCAGAFRSRKYQVWQLVLSPQGVPGGYRSVRTLNAKPRQESASNCVVTVPEKHADVTVAT